MIYMYKSVIRFAAIMMAAVASVIPSSIYAQEYENTPVTVSKEKLKIGDQICYSHIVLEKQTLFSICKAYNVTLEDIYRFNPSVKEKGLQKNSILMIPLIEEVKQEQPKVLEQPKEQEQAAPRKTHIVKWFEDLDLIAVGSGHETGQLFLGVGLGLSGEIPDAAQTIGAVHDGFQQRNVSRLHQ
jgi:hypothetical protein